MLEAVRIRPSLVPALSRPEAVSASARQAPFALSAGQWRSMLVSGAAVVAVSAAAIAILLLLRDTMAGIGAWGLVGAFFAELGNSAVILVPTPGPAYTFAMGATLNPFLLGVAGGVGAALGELTGYFLGTRGRRVMEGWSLYSRLAAVTSRWTGPMLLVLAALPIPFDLAGVWAGSTRYPVGRRFRNELADVEPIAQIELLSAPERNPATGDVFHGHRPGRPPARRVAGDLEGHAVRPTVPSSFAEVLVGPAGFPAVIHQSAHVVGPFHLVGIWAGHLWQHFPVSTLRTMRSGSSVSRA